MQTALSSTLTRNSKVIDAGWQLGTYRIVIALTERQHRKEWEND